MYTLVMQSHVYPRDAITCVYPGHDAEDHAALELPPKEFIHENFFTNGVKRVVKPGGVAAINIIAYDVLILAGLTMLLQQVCCAQQLGVEENQSRTIKKKKIKTKQSASFYFCSRGFRFCSELFFSV